MPTNEELWNEFVSSGKFHAVEQQPLKVGDLVIDKDEGKVCRVESIDLESDTARINNGRRIYDYPIEDTRPAKETGNAAIEFMELSGKKRIVENGKGGLKIQRSVDLGRN